MKRPNAKSSATGFHCDEILSETSEEEASISLNHPPVHMPAHTPPPGQPAGSGLDTHIAVAIHHMSRRLSATWLFRHTDTMKTAHVRCSAQWRERYIARLGGVDCADDLSVICVAHAAFPSSAICVAPMQTLRVAEGDRTTKAPGPPRVEIEAFNAIAGEARIVTMRPAAAIRELVRIINMD